MSAELRECWIVYDHKRERAVVQDVCPGLILPGQTFVHYVARSSVEGALRRDWSVRVLDAWAHDFRRARYWFTDQLEHGYACYIRGRNPGEECFLGQVADDARLAAAEAVWPELSTEVRAELGERP